MMKYSPSIWHLLHIVKLMVKISSIFVAFLENIYFNHEIIHVYLNFIILRSCLKIYTTKIQRTMRVVLRFTLLPEMVICLFANWSFKMKMSRIYIPSAKEVWLQFSRLNKMATFLISGIFLDTWDLHSLEIFAQTSMWLWPTFIQFGKERES